MKRGVDKLAIKVIAKDDGAIGADSFLSIVKETINMLREFDPDNALSWKITSANMQSPLLLEFSAYQNEDKQYPQTSPSFRLADTLSRLDNGEIPVNVPPKAFSRASRLANALNNGVAKIVITADGHDPVSPTQRIQATVSELSNRYRSVYSERTTLEGDLRTVSVDGGSNFVVFDRITGHKSVCIIPHDQLANAKSLLERRVWVKGLVRFKNGWPEQVEAENFGAMPERKDLPQFKDIIGIDITDGEDSVAFIRRHRDAD